jgi:uncharacterized protein YwgA
LETKLPSIRELNGLLNRIGNFDPDEFEEDFDSRLILQKTIYLLQAFGLNLGYRYSWYLRGPYSSELAHATYSVANCYDDEATIKFSNKNDETRFRKFLVFLGNKKDNQEWMETTASIHFLAKLYGEQNDALVFEMVRDKMGSQLSRTHFAEIWNKLWLNGLLAMEITQRG